MSESMTLEEFGRLSNRDFENGAVLDEIAASLAELEYLRRNLPKTKDGVTNLPGDTVWRPEPNGVSERWVYWCPGTKLYLASWGIESRPVPVEECYSTREAAEAAGES